MSENVKQVPLSAKARLELAFMAYARWEEAYKALKEAKALTWESAGKFCPKGEWSLYHADMVKAAQAEFALTTALTAEICPHSPTGEQLS